MTELFTQLSLVIQTKHKQGDTHELGISCDYREVRTGIHQQYWR